MKWHWVNDDLQNESMWLSHAIPDSLYTAIMENLHSRGFYHYGTKEIDGTLSFDLPGMCSMNREYRQVEVDGLTIEIPCTDWEYIYDKLLARKERDDANLPYYKLHGFNRCIVLTPDQRDEMLKQMLAQMVEVNAQREIENRAWNEAMANMPGAVVADGPKDAQAALARAKAEGKRTTLLVGKRPVKDDIGEA